MSERECVLELARRYTPCDLPIGVYVVLKNGRFVECNSRVREILGLPLEGPVDAFITDFYKNPSQRKELVEELEEAERQGKWIEKIVIPFSVNGRELFIQDYCRSIRDPRTKEIVGYVGCLVDVSEEERYRLLFDRLPAGVYRLDEMDRVAHVNRATVEMLGYDSEGELVGLPAERLYANPEEAAVFHEKVMESGSVVGEKVELLKKNKETIFVSANAFKLTSSDGSYAGREGTITDITTEERYHRIVEDVPVGFYMVRVENGEDIIRQCNKQFVHIFEFDGGENPIGFNIKELYSTRQDYPRFMREIREKDSQNQPLLGYPLRVRTRKDRDIVIEVNSRVLHDRKGRVIGRAGVVRDITEEASLREQVREFTDDIGNMLHVYTSTLLMLNLSVKSVIATLGDDPFDSVRFLDPQEAATVIQEQTQHLMNSLGKLLLMMKSTERATALPAEKRNNLSRLHGLLRDHSEIRYLQFRPPTVRLAAQCVSEICNEIEQRKLPREPVRQVQRDAWEVMRVCSLVSLHRASDAVLAMDTQVRSLREYVTFGIRVKEPEVSCKIGTLINRAISNLEEFAKNQEVSIRFGIDDPGILVSVVERDVVRAFINLLHNAIKYSWVRKNGEPLWVRISSRTEQDQVLVEFENWGVPIPKDEIEQGLVFLIGFRGRMSSDRGRIGTGVGLSDSRRVARSHGGDVVIRSRPATPGGNEDNLDQPFITTAAFKLPISLEQGGRDETEDSLD